MDLEAELLKSIDKEELEEMAKEKIRSFHGFLTREVALRLIAKEKGLLKEEAKEYAISEIPKGAKGVTFRGRIRKIWPAASYSSGKRSRVIEVSDDSGWKPLVLWNDDVALASRLKVGDRILVRNAYEKGGELHLGYSGDVEITEKAAIPRLSEITDGTCVHANGIVMRLEGYDTFIKEGKPRRGFSFIISDGETERRCVLIEGMDRAGRIKEKDEVRIQNAYAESGSLFIDADARIMVKPPGMLIGNLESLECEGESLKMRVAGKELELGREEALSALGASVAPDIALSTVVALKKDKLLNTRLALHIQDGRVVVRG